MTYIDNIFICLAAPLLIGMLCAGRGHKRTFLFILAGMGACLLSAYVNSFFAVFYGADVTTATAEITPMVEEIMKVLPLLFYLLVFEPEKEDARIAVIVIAASFATFENICWLTENGADQMQYLLIRGLSTGSMHVVCGATVGYGLLFVWSRPSLRVGGTLGLLCTAITFHAMYNLLIAADSPVREIGYSLPLVTLIAAFTVVRLYSARMQE